MSKAPTNGVCTRLATRVHSVPVHPGRKRIKSRQVNINLLCAAPLRVHRKVRLKRALPCRCCAAIDGYNARVPLNDCRQIRVRGARRLSVPQGFQCFGDRFVRKSINLQSILAKPAYCHCWLKPGTSSGAGAVSADQRRPEIAASKMTSCWRARLGLHRGCRSSTRRFGHRRDRRVLR